MSRIEPDPWLTGHVGAPAGRVVVDGPLDEVADEIRATLAAPSFLAAKVPCADVASVSALECLGFHVVDVNVTLSRPLAMDDRPSPHARFATADDEDDVAALAGRLMRSRFHLDPRFPDAIADALKQDWVKSFWRGTRGAWMVVGELDGRVVGFNQLLHDERRVVIDLIAVDDAARRHGIARSMIAFAAASCGPADELLVGTQVANVPSLRLYESMGFRVAGTSYVLHAHGRR